MRCNRQHEQLGHGISPDFLGCQKCLAGDDIVLDMETVQVIEESSDQGD